MSATVIDTYAPTERVASISISSIRPRISADVRDCIGLPTTFDLEAPRLQTSAHL